MNKIHESGENYLEAILLIKKEKGNVRAIDIAAFMGYSKPSISRAMKILQSEGLIEIDSSSNIHLSQSGHVKAEKIYYRHKILTEFLCCLGVDKQTSETDACKIEHVISEQTLNCISDFVNNKNKNL